MADRFVTVDGNEAAARVAHALSEVIAIYPITPASPMGELSDACSQQGHLGSVGIYLPQLAEGSYRLIPSNRPNGKSPQRGALSVER